MIEEISCNLPGCTELHTKNLSGYTVSWLRFEHCTSGVEFCNDAAREILSVALETVRAGELGRFILPECCLR